MTAALAIDAGICVREAEPRDNDALRAIAAACTMNGDIALCVTREPDFFALNRLEGDGWRAGVAEVDGDVVGCVMVAEREAYLNGRVTQTFYGGDLKVHPAHRGAGVANALTRWAYDYAADVAGADVPVLLTVLRGTRPMERRTDGRAGLPPCTLLRTIRAYSIPLFWPRRREPVGGIRVVDASLADCEEMAHLWRRVAPDRQFAPLLDARAIAAAMSVPGDVRYRIARARDGSILGFAGWWDQNEFKQTHVIRYSRRLAVARAVTNTAARILGTPGLPAPGEQLRYRTAVNVCVPNHSPAVLGALVRHACAEFREQSYPFITIGLDMRDPATAALRGLFAQPTGIGAYISTPSGAYRGPDLSGRPMHYEIALV